MLGTWWVDLAREARWAFSGPEPYCSCTLSFLVLGVAAAFCVGLISGAVLTCVVISPRCRSFLSQLLHLALNTWGDPAPAPGGALARLRLREYRS